MFGNYVKIAWRNLLRHRTFSLINLFGLSVSIAFCLLLFFHIRYEQSFDGFHVKKDRLFRVEKTDEFADPRHQPKKSFFSLLSRGNDDRMSDIFPLAVGPDMQTVFPEILSYTRWKEGVEEFVKAGSTVYRQNDLVYADSNFFRNFSFKVIAGDPEKALAHPRMVILAAGTAKKYFGDKDPIGQTIELVSDSNKLFSVAAIAADPPANSSIQFSMILPLVADSRYLMNINEKFNHSDHYLVVELRPGTDQGTFQKKLNDWMRGYYFPTVQSYLKFAPDLDLSHYHWSFRPLAECHYNVSDWGHYTDADSIYQLCCIVIIILALAALNYILITVSRAAARSQEIGVRKVMGAARWSVVLQSWTETQLIVGLATLAGVVLSRAGIPLLHMAIDSGVTASAISWRDVSIAALMLTLILSFIAGLYPALLMSRLKPVRILQSFQTFRVDPRFSRVLVIFQFSCCILMMMAVFVIGRQMSYINHKDLGFDKEQVLVVHNPVFDSRFSARLHDAMRDFAASQPGVTGLSGVNGQLNGIGSMNGLQLNGQRYWYRQYGIDYNYIDLLHLKVVRGRNFSTDYPTDTVRRTRPVLVNETLWNLLGDQAKLGYFCAPLQSTIIGVVKDYHLSSLSKKIEPAALTLATGWIGYYYLKIAPGKTGGVISALQKQWAGMADHYPLEYTFLDEQIAKMYVPERRWQQTVEVSCLFAILIACLGLFGLSAINAANRTKEIGIRKVLGAELNDLLASLTSGFVRMVGLAVLISAPLGWWLMNKWLDDFAYRIEIRWWMLAVVGAVAFLIGLATVSFTVWRAARANPVESLRDQ